MDLVAQLELIFNPRAVAVNRGCRATETIDEDSQGGGEAKAEGIPPKFFLLFAESEIHAVTWRNSDYFLLS